MKLQNLKDGFYYGVRQNVREGLRYYYEVLQADYTALLTKTRSIEAENLILLLGLQLLQRQLLQ